MYHRFQNIWPLYKDISAKLTQNKNTRANISNLKKKPPHKLITVTRYHDGQYFQKHTRSPKEISLKRCFEHLFMYLRLMKKSNIDFP